MKKKYFNVFFIFNTVRVTSIKLIVGCFTNTNFAQKLSSIKKSHFILPILPKTPISTFSAKFILLSLTHPELKLFWSISIKNERQKLIYRFLWVCVGDNFLKTVIIIKLPTKRCRQYHFRLKSLVVILGLKYNFQPFFIENYHKLHFIEFASC